ncbi:MAG TPA: aminoglycoside phosphotransferase family protein [Acidimicrobiales bacterium]|nr:aminoglycoside phosphotransferase family protein [Acidimicrobiales bacterium]
MSHDATRHPRHPNQRDIESLPPELRRTTVPPAVRAWVERQAGVRIVRVRRLPGASSTAVHGLYSADGTRLVLRRYAWPGFLDDEPIAPRREVDALRFASAHGLSVPELVAADLTGGDIGDDVPALLMSFVPGRAVAGPDAGRLAEVAALIHATDPTGFAHDYFPWFADSTVAPPPASPWPRLWEAAIGLWHDAMPGYTPRFIHRDFHPGNVLWWRGRAAGVVDWANACAGPCGCDLATCRANLVDLAGDRAADDFQAAYESLTGETLHPYWEMASILENGPSYWTPRQLADTEPQLARAVGAQVELPPR